jgi:hypothetical protein
LVASLQTSEVCKIVLGVGNTLRNRIVFVDLRDMTFSEMTLASQTGTQAAQRAMPT